MLKIFSSQEEILRKAAEIFSQSAKDAIKEKGYFSVSLTGGSSPKGLYQLLATDEYKKQIDWSKILVFWGDERWVPLDHELSNTKMAYEILLNHVPIPQENIFPMYKEGVKPEVYAAAYETQLKEKLGDDATIDLMLLGMGDDGHTASLFPQTEVLNEKKAWVSAYYLNSQEMYRITLTAPFINRAKNIVVITFGDAKAPALKQVLKGEYDPATYPSQLLDPVNGELLYLVDQKAAKFL